VSSLWGASLSDPLIVPGGGRKGVPGLAMLFFGVKLRGYLYQVGHRPG
jgi:hypothetical protein